MTDKLISVKEREGEVSLEYNSWNMLAQCVHNA